MQKSVGVRGSKQRMWVAMKRSPYPSGCRERKILQERGELSWIVVREGGKLHDTTRGGEGPHTGVTF